MRPARQFRLADAGASPVRQEAVFTPFRVDIAPDRDAVRVCPVGELDLATVGRVGAHLDELAAAGFKRVVLDLRGATFLDSTGLRLIVGAHRSSADDGWELAIVPGPDVVQRVFDIAGLTAHLPFVDSPSAANGSRWA